MKNCVELIDGEIGCEALNSTKFVLTHTHTHTHTPVLVVPVVLVSGSSFPLGHADAPPLLQPVCSSPCQLVYYAIGGNAEVGVRQLGLIG